MKTGKIIGFGGKFYTLWNYRVEDRFNVDAYGKSHLVARDTIYEYVKNVSFDVERVKSEYPGLTIDESLRGTTTWTKSEKIEMPLEIFNFGRYEGHSIEKIWESDQQYVLWFLQNYDNQRTEFARTLKPIVEHFATEAKVLEELRSKFPVAVSGLNELLIVSNARVCQDENDENFFYVTAVIENEEAKTVIEVRINDAKMCSYHGFDYYLPVIGGKAKKLKNKAVTWNIEVIFTSTESVERGFQIAKLIEN